MRSTLIFNGASVTTAFAAPPSPVARIVAVNVVPPWPVNG